ncbi:MAG: hypothetical protein ACM32I_00270 [Nitrospirota bacterium]
MNIEISTKEYRDLLDILHIADVVMSGHRREEDQRTGGHRALIQKLYAYAQDTGLNGLITYNENVKKYIPTQNFEKDSMAHAVIDQYGDHLFWDQLISRLTERDAAQTVGGTERLRAMADSERQHVEGHIRQRYVEEFSMNGVSNLAVVEGFAEEGGKTVRTSD